MGDRLRFAGSGVILLLSVAALLPPALGWIYVPAWVPIVIVIAAALAGVGLGVSLRKIEAAPTPVEADGEPLVPRLMDAVGDPLLLVDDRRRIILANASATQLLGDMLGEDVRVALRHPAATALLLADAPQAERSAELIALGGREGHWEMVVVPIGGGDLLVRLIDRSGARAVERTRTDFVANASHELRTPLATLLGFIETLSGAAANDEKARGRFLAIMEGEAKRMTRLLDDLLSLSRIETDKHRQPTQGVALLPLAKEVADALGHSPNVSEIRTDIAASLTNVLGDRDQLLQLLHNLVGNAIKYGRAGGRVTIAAEPAGGEIRLIVTDDGEGIAPDHLPRLTERFYRVDTSRSRALGGTGLGLAIVKHIVERHRGRLSIDSTLGVGTTVTVTLPAAR